MTNAMYQRGLIFLFAIMFASHVFGQSRGDEYDTCSLTSVPEDAVRQAIPLPTGTANIVAFPDPDTVPNNFNGCMNRWMEASGTTVRILEARFVNGGLTWYRAGDGEIYCEYENDKGTGIGFLLCQFSDRHGR